MNVNIWEILGIHATDESSEIRRAYAEQLKTHHPEDDPDGFQRLRQAYEQALKYTKIRAMIAAGAKAPDQTDKTADRSGESKKEADIGDQPHPFAPVILSDEAAFRNPSNDSRTGMKELFESALVLYDDFYARIEIENWKKFLQAEQLWDMSLKEEIRWDVLSFFVEHPDLPQPVWLLLDSEFHWSQRFGYVPPDAVSDLAALSLELDPYWDFDYINFHNNGSVDFALYSQYRRKVKTAILEGDREAVSRNFDLAVNLYAEDLTFFLIYHDYLHSTRGSDFFGPSLEERLQTVNEMIGLYPDNPKYLLDRAKIYMEQSLFEKAAGEYLMLLKIYPDNLDIPFQLMRAYEKMNREFREVLYLTRILFTSSRIRHRLNRKLTKTDGNRDILIQIRCNEYTWITLKSSKRYKEHYDHFSGPLIILVTGVALVIGLLINSVLDLIYSHQ